MSARLASSRDVNSADDQQAQRTPQDGPRESPEARLEAEHLSAGQSRGLADEEQLDETKAVAAPSADENVAKLGASCDTASLAPFVSQPDELNEKHEGLARADDLRGAPPTGRHVQDRAHNVRTPVRLLDNAPAQKASYSPANHHYQPRAHYVYQPPLPPVPSVYPTHQAPFLPITVHGQYQLATPSFAYPAVGGSQLFWNHPPVAYPGPIVPAAPTGYHQPFCHPQAPLIGSQPVYAPPFHFEAQPQLHPAPVDVGALRSAANNAQQVPVGCSLEAAAHYARVETNSRQTPSAIENACGGRIAKGEETAGRPDRSTNGDAASRDMSDAETNASDDNESGRLAQHNAGDARPASGASDSDTDREHSQRGRHVEQRRQARQACASVRAHRISYRASLARYNQLEQAADCHFVDKLRAQEQQTPTHSSGSRTLEFTTTQPPEEPDSCDAYSQPVAKSSSRKLSSDFGNSTTSISMVPSHGSISKQADNDEEEADEQTDEGFADTCRGSGKNLREKEVVDRTVCATFRNVERVHPTADDDLRCQEDYAEQAEEGHMGFDEAASRVATAAKRDKVESKSAGPPQRPVGSHYHDGKQQRVASNKQHQTQTSHVSINGTTFYNVPNGVLNRIAAHQSHQQTQQHPYNSHLVLPYASYQGTLHYYQQPFAVAYPNPYYYSNQATLTFGSHHQQALQVGHELTSGFYQSAPVYQAFSGQYAHSTAPHQASLITSQTSSSQVPAHHHYLDGTPNGGLNLSFSQLKLGYNLIPLLPIEASPTRIRQAYGMDKVWQDEFEVLFSKFISSVVWTLVEVETVPNVRNTSRILNYKGRFIVRVGSSSSSTDRSGESSEKSFIVAGTNQSSRPSVHTPSCSSETDDNTSECASPAEPVNDQSSLSDVDDVEPDCASLDCNDEKVADSDQSQSDCDSGAIFNSPASGSSESASHECNGSEASGEKLTPAGSPPLQLERADKGDDVIPPVSSMTEPHGRKFPLRFKMFIDSAKVRFCCDNCGHGWTSMKGRVVFWYELFELIDDSDGISNLIGYCAYKLFGQQCDVCKIENRFERPMWYPEEVSKVLANLYNKIGQVYFGFKMPMIDKQRRAGKPKTSHNSLLCQACHDGVCTDRK